MHLPAIVSSTFARLLTVMLLSVTAAGVRADVVTDWNATLEAALRNPTPSPAVQVRAAASSTSRCSMQ